MTKEKALNLFSKKYPKLTITKIVDYDKTHFVICAIENIDNMYEELDPFYAVDKVSGKITYFSPAGDLKHFGKLMME